MFLLPILREILQILKVGLDSYQFPDHMANFYGDQKLEPWDFFQTLEENNEKKKHWNFRVPQPLYYTCSCGRHAVGQCSCCSLLFGSNRLQSTSTVYETYTRTLGQKPMR